MRSVGSVCQSVATLALVGLLTGLCGCAVLNEGAGLPVSGPESFDVKAGRSDTSLKYGLVKLTPEAITILHDFETERLRPAWAVPTPGAFTDGAPPAQNQIRHW